MGTQVLKQPLAITDLIPELQDLQVRYIASARLRGSLTQRDVFLEDDVGALHYMREQVFAAREKILYPSQVTATPLPLECCYLPSTTGADGAMSPNGWSSLISDCLYLVAHLYHALLDLEAAGAGDGDPDLRAHRAQLVLRALRLALQAQMYEIRANANGLPRVPAAGAEAPIHPDDVLGPLASANQRYRDQVRAWHLDALLPLGERHEGDVAAYDTWSREFGQARDQEDGWGRFADRMRKEMRYQKNMAKLRLRWIVATRLQPSEHTTRGQHPVFMQRLQSQVLAWTLRLQSVAQAIGRRLRHVRRVLWTVSTRLGLLLWALGLLILWALAGFGLRPRRFAFTVAFTVLGYSLAYMVDDLAGRCNHVSLSLPSYGRALYDAIANLLTAGGASGSNSPCGPMTGLLISTEPLVGYFLLSLLAAMLLAWLTDR